MKHSILNDYNDLMTRYAFSRIDDKYPRSKTIPCPERHEKNHSAMFGMKECYCDGGVYHARITWVNTESTWTARVGDDTVLLMDFGNWFSVGIFKGLKGTLPVDKNNLSTPRSDREACSTDWYGEEAGSGIRRFPESLKGFMYRGPVEGCRDAHFLPKTDIVSHLRELLDTLTEDECKTCEKVQSECECE